MHRANQIQNVLTLLAKNVKSKVQPDLVDSGRIANELNLTLTETKQILKTMHDMGMIESNMEAEYSLITRFGLNSLEL